MGLFSRNKVGEPAEETNQSDVSFQSEEEPNTDKEPDTETCSNCDKEVPSSELNDDGYCKDCVKSDEDREANKSKYCFNFKIFYGINERDEENNLLIENITKSDANDMLKKVFEALMVKQDFIYFDEIQYADEDGNLKAFHPEIDSLKDIQRVTIFENDDDDE